MEFSLQKTKIPAALSLAVFLFALSLGVSIAVAADHSPDEMADLLEMLGSDDPQSRQAAYHRITEMSSVPEDIARALVFSTVQLTPNPRGYTPYGPEIDARPACEPIVKHIDKTRPFLMEALSSDNWSIRASAALCLGMGCVECATGPLKAALIKEVKVVEEARVRDPSVDGVHPFLSSWIAVFEAYASLNPDDAVEFALSLFSPSQRDVRNFLANFTLARIARDGSRPPYTVSDDESWSNSRQEQWVTWWKKNRGRASSEVIRLWLLDLCAQSP